MNPRILYCFLLLGSITLAGSQTLRAAETALLPAASLSPLTTTRVRSVGSSSLGAVSPNVSADGAAVWFASRSADLQTNVMVTGRFQQWFRRDLNTSRTELISVGVAGAEGNGDSFGLSLALDGASATFVSDASNLTVGDSNLVSDVFFWSAANARLIRISQASDGASANGPSRNAVISGDGRYVYFESLASNLTGDAPDGFVGLYRWEAATRRIVCVRTAPDGTLAQAPGADAFYLALAPDGESVLFSSRARPFNVSFTNPGSNPLAHRSLDLATNSFVNLLLSAADPGAVTSRFFAFLDPGQIVFRGMISGKVKTNGLFSARLALRTIQPLAPDLITDARVGGDDTAGPLVRAAGRSVLFEARPFSPKPDVEAVYAYSMDTGARTLVSTETVAFSAAAPAVPYGVLLDASEDGNVVAYLTAKPGSVYPIADGHVLALRNLTTGEVRYPIRSSAGEMLGIEDTPSVSLSRDGGVVAIATSSGAFAAPGASRTSQVFLYRWKEDRAELVSSQVPGALARAAGGFRVSRPWLSADGQWAAFSSDRPDLVGQDGNAAADVFVKNLNTGSTELISTQASGNGSAAGASREASISADGRWVVFTSNAPDLVPRDTNRLDDVFLFDRQARVMRLVSRSMDGVGSANGPSGDAEVSDDGRWVLFVSSASNLVSGGTGGRLIYRYEVATGVVSEAVRSGGALARPISMRKPQFSPDGSWFVFRGDTSLNRNWNTYTASIADGRFQRAAESVYANRETSSAVEMASFSTKGDRVAFSQAFLTTAPRSVVFVYDRASGVTQAIATNAIAPSLSADGLQLAYELSAPGGLAGARTQVRVRQLPTGVEEIVSRGSGEGLIGSAHCVDPAMTSDGAFVIYSSQSTNLVDGVSSGFSDLYVRDRRDGRTWLLTRSMQGAGGGDGTSGMPMIGRDGRTLLFISHATNLTGDSVASTAGEAYLVRLPVGSEPLRVTQIQRLSTGEITLVWPRIEGRRYRVEIREDFEGSMWTSADLVQTAEGGSMRVSDRAVTAARRFYRVVEGQP